MEELTKWMQWTEMDYHALMRHEWVTISRTTGHGVWSSFDKAIHWSCSADDYDDMKKLFQSMSAATMPGWEIVQRSSIDTVVAGPFNSLDAAKAAYLLMEEMEE